MDHFRFYNLEPSFNPDQLLVKRKFYELSKLYHPDFYIGEPEQKQQEILELSTQNNKAYQVLSDPRKRLKYVLELKGIIAEDEKYQLPPDFLMEMMEVNEVLMELEFEADADQLNKVSREVDELEKTLDDDMQRLAALADQQPTGNDATLAALKDLYYRQKYLLRIRDSLNKFATR